MGNNLNYVLFLYSERKRIKDGVNTKRRRRGLKALSTNHFPQRNTTVNSAKILLNM